MKKTLLSGAIVLVLIAVWAVYQQMHVSRTLQLPAPVVAREEGVTCHDAPQYTAIEKSLAPDVGSKILVRFKTSAAHQVPCTYAPVAGDFELGRLEATYFLAFTDHFLLLDAGTAPPPRSLIVYDMRTRKQSFTDSYAKPVDVSGDSITYWAVSSATPNGANCPQLADYTANGLGAVIMEKEMVDLTTGRKTALGPTECRARQ